MAKYSYLIDVDPIVVRSFLYLIPFDDLVNYTSHINVELLDMLVVVLSNTPADITYSSVTVSEAGVLKGYLLGIEMEIEIWDFSFTDCN